jgi:hypothetical protein
MGRSKQNATQQNATQWSRGANIALVVAAGALAAISIVWFSPYLSSVNNYTSFTAIGIAQKIATPWFVLSYSATLLAITLISILRSELRVAREQANAAQLIEILEGESSPDQRLRLLNRLTDARITTIESCRNELLTSRERLAASHSSILRATASLLGGLTSVPAVRHSLEGLRPAVDVLDEQVHRHTPRLAGLGDFVIRLALLGTFAGLIAALTIASANIGIVQASEQAQSDQMRQFIEQLLASAATKFWISAVGIGCALLLRVCQIRLDSQIAKLTAKVGLAFDVAVARPEVARAWCPRAVGGFDPVSEQLFEIAEKIREHAKDWVLSVDMGGDQDSVRPQLKMAERGGR